MSQSEDSVIECPKCHYLHIGTNIRSMFDEKSSSSFRRFQWILVCNGCGNDIPERIKLPRGILFEDLYRYIQARGGVNDSDDDENENDDDNDVVIIPDAEQPETKTKEEKKAEAVEKPMEEKDLTPYYNRYILLMIDQRQHKESCSKEQLNEYLTDLFHSLQYKNDESNGNIQ